jgi:hypothetical protein
LRPTDGTARAVCAHCGAQEKITTTRVLIQALRDRDVGVRAEAVELLGVLGQSADGRTKAEIVANKYLISALRDPNTFVRTKVLSVIGARKRLAAQQQAVSTAPPGDTGRPSAVKSILLRPGPDFFGGNPPPA